MSRTLNRQNMNVPPYFSGGVLFEPIASGKRFTEFSNVVALCELYDDTIEEYPGYVILFLGENGEPRVSIRSYMALPTKMILGDDVSTDNITYMSASASFIGNSTIFYLTISYSDGLILQITIGHEDVTKKSYLTCFNDQNLMHTFSKSDSLLVFSDFAYYEISNNPGSAPEVRNITDENPFPLEAYQTADVGSVRNDILNCLSYRPIYVDKLIGFLILNHGRTLKIVIIHRAYRDMFRVISSKEYYDVDDYSSLVITTENDVIQYATFLIKRTDNMIHSMVLSANESGVMEIIEENDIGPDVNAKFTFHYSKPKKISGTKRAAS